MDEKLNQVIHKIELICNQNPEFKQKLIKALGVTPNANLVVTTNLETERKIEKIETYLGLDYKVDSIMPQDTIYDTIDYSFITISSVKDKLMSDFREMMRYRYGTRSHKVDFYEFCKYAHYQLEALTNEFFISYSLKDVDIAKKFIDDYFPIWKGYTPVFKDNLQDIKQIEYDQKVSSMINFLDIGNLTISQTTDRPKISWNIFDIISNIRKMRNDMSHRCAEQEERIEVAINNFEKYPPRTNDYGYYVFDRNRAVKDYLWRRRTPYDDVIKVLTIICDSIKSQLQ